MKKMLLSFFLLIILLGCGPSLQELQTVPPTHTIDIHKEVFCVFSKLNGKTIEHQNEGAYWQSNWDPSSHEGTIVYFASGIGNLPLLLFSINNNDADTTKIEVKVPHSSRMKIQKIASSILSSADFSGCPDLK